MVVADSNVEETLKAQRRSGGADRWDEVWDGVYFMSPPPSIEHQFIVGMIFAIVQGVVSQESLGVAFPGINGSDRKEDWTKNYRCPDVAVFLKLSTPESSAQLQSIVLPLHFRLVPGVSRPVIESAHRDGRPLGQA